MLSYTDNKGKKHSACHTSRKKARGQIAAIEAEGIERNEPMKITLSELRRIISEVILNEQLVSYLDQLGLSISDRTPPDDAVEIARALVNKTSSPSMIPDPVLLSAIDKIKSMLAFGEPDAESIKNALLNLPKPPADPKKEREAIEKEYEERAKMVAGLKGKRPRPFEKGEELRFQSLSEPSPLTQKNLNESMVQALRSLVREFVLEEAKKKKKKSKSKGSDMDGDGDVDAADYKTKVYMAGGVPRDEAIKKSRKFDGK